ncbi:ABC-type multidrug transport system fused ATPase/permease subunit [Lewinella aquimaris]|uniref:ABC-type multidrug transport system fused ATPase/permease subunit n=1 Tax=Neolewinella aquimaris TaxID=1835722 RepID=A0A840EER1_9BACT|nr:ABC transporter ATP-binding protein [Neolewinella aquimaris]MBB4080289.1 ABC-type multidrug transport system fused ATPase/permease subunit [Neolewinella aquimaris]
MKGTLRQWAEFFSSNPYQHLLSTSWHYARGMRGRYVLIYVMFTCVNLIVSVQPIIFGYFINYLQEGRGDLTAAAWIYGGAYMATILGFWAFQWPARLMERRMAYEISRRLLMETYDRVVHLPLEWHRRHHSGDTINRTRKAYEALKAFFDDGFVYFQTLVRMLFSIAAIIYFSAIFGGVAGATGILIVLAVLAFDRPIIAVTKETNERENDLLAGLTDNLGNIITVTTLRLGKQTLKRIDKRISAVWPPFLRNTQLNEQKWFTTGVLIGLMYAIIVIGYVHQNYVPGEVFLVGGLVTLIGYVNQFTNMFNALTGQYNTVIRLRADLAAIDPITEAYRKRARPELPPGSKVVKDWREINVDGLHFTYDRENEESRGLTDVSLTLGRGQRIAFIGPSGSGKTTLLYNLRGLYPPDAITVRFDGRQADSPAQLYEQTTLIPQSPEIFEDTILQNLTMGLPRKPAAIERALHLAAMEDVIANAENGLETHLSEGGANLSGGQRQRLSIARGLLAADTSTLLLLDEPTSSLDPRSETLVYQRLFAAFPDKTIVSTLHRLHLLREFDYIYYLEGGRVVHEGTLEELLEASELFRMLWEQQAAG